MYIVKLAGDVWMCRCFQGGWHFTYVEENAEKTAVNVDAVTAANCYCQGWSSYEVIEKRDIHHENCSC